jgi:RNA polymerase sigma factor (sigma-70 family)
MTGHGENQPNEWFVRAVAGDRSSFDSLLLYFHDPLRQFIGASIALGDAADITHDDLFQETIVAAIRGVRSIEPRGADAFFSWLKEIARNTHLNMVKAANAQKRGGGRQAFVGNENADSAATSILGKIAGCDPAPSLIFRRKEAIEAIAVAITKLNPEQRQLVDLYYKPGMTVRDIAGELGKSEEAIRTGIHRTLNRLRDILAADFGEFSTGL